MQGIPRPTTELAKYRLVTDRTLAFQIEAFVLWCEMPLKERKVKGGTWPVIPFSGLTKISIKTNWPGASMPIFAVQDVFHGTPWSVSDRQKVLRVWGYYISKIEKALKEEDTWRWFDSDYYLFGNRLWHVPRELLEEEEEEEEEEEDKFEIQEPDLIKAMRLVLEKAKIAGERPTRQVISVSVRREVWRRDQGCCVRCGSREKLEFDHIIPVVKGGSNTARNIELLCENCNRNKGASI